MALSIIKKAGVHRVPVPPSIQPGLLIQGAMDNFDHEENTKSGIGGSHDTILMLFQNPDKDEQEEPRQLSTKPTAIFEERALDCILDCQKLFHFCKYGGRGQILDNFTPEASLDTHNIEVSANYDFMTWVIARFATKANVPDYTSCDTSCDKAGVPSFMATNSLIKYEKYPLTRIAFTQIIAHPATEYDTIYTCMKNFQDVVSQNDLECGLLWCVEGVYRIAKELQLSDPDGFSNIFNGLGGFHIEKVIISCIGKFLEESWIENIFIENEIFGPGVVENVLSGGHYVHGKHGIALISEALHWLQLLQFLKISDCAAF